jgi:hypothetical protein
VLRLTGERSLLELTGILSHEESETLHEAVEDCRARYQEDVE